MIQTQTFLKVADNTGARKLMCIRFLGNNLKSGIVGNIFIGVIKKISSNKMFKKSTIVKAIVIRTKKKIFRLDGTYINFNENAAVILNKDYTPKGTRIFGPVPKEIREHKFFKIISIAKEII